MKKFLLLPFFLAILSGCSADYSATTISPVVHESPALIESSVNANVDSQVPAKQEEAIAIDDSAVKEDASVKNAEDKVQVLDKDDISSPVEPVVDVPVVKKFVADPALTVKAVQEVTKPQVQEKAPTSNTELSNDNYYTNSAGNKVHSPANAPSVPEGASARCKDGTYSFSQSRRGTCSRHGGVAEWY